MNIERIIEIANESRNISEEIDSGEFKNLLDKISEAVRVVGRASTQSWLGYQSHVYYRGFSPPQPGDHFSSEWGFKSTFAHPTSRNWVEVSFDEVNEAVNQIAENPDKTNFENRSIEVKKMFKSYHLELMALLSVALESTNSEVIEELRDKR